MVRLVTFVSLIGARFLKIDFWSVFMKSWILSFCTALFLVGCGSTVPLNDVPVTDATAKTVSGTDAQAGSGAVVQSGGAVSYTHLDVYKRQA